MELQDLEAGRASVAPQRTAGEAAVEEVAEAEAVEAATEGVAQAEAEAAGGAGVLASSSHASDEAAPPTGAGAAVRVKVTCGDRDGDGKGEGGGEGDGKGGDEEVLPDSEASEEGDCCPVCLNSYVGADLVIELPCARRPRAAQPLHQRLQPSASRLQP